MWWHAGDFMPTKSAGCQCHPSFRQAFDGGMPAREIGADGLKGEPATAFLYCRRPAAGEKIRQVNFLSSHVNCLLGCSMHLMLLPIR
jgi:hypothetical protein